MRAPSSSRRGADADVACPKNGDVTTAAVVQRAGVVDEMPLTRTVDVHVAGLRQKGESNPKSPDYILTIHSRLQVRRLRTRPGSLFAPRLQDPS